MSSKRLVLISTLCAVLASASAACVVNEPDSPPRGVVVSGPPPAPVREERPAPPSPQAVWVSGYWHWSGMQYAWIPGHWDSPPPGASWNAPVYTVRDGKYFYETGSWNRTNGGQREPGQPGDLKNAIR